VDGLVSWLYLYFAHGEDLALSELPFMTGAIVGAATWVAALFIWNLACAPFRIQRDRADALQSTVDSLNAGRVDADATQIRVIDDYLRARGSLEVQLLQVARLALQYKRLTEASIAHSSLRGEIDYKELAECGSTVFAALQQVVPNVAPVTPKGGFKLQIETNKLLIIFDQPMTRPPSFVINTDIDGLIGEATRVTKYSAEMIFSNVGGGQSYVPENFRYALDAEITP